MVLIWLCQIPIIKSNVSMATITTKAFQYRHPHLHLHLHLRPRPSQATPHRTYHSYEHDAPPPFTPAENAILTAAFPHIPTHGFTTVALSRGARDVGYLDASINLFPTGAFALVNHYLITQRMALAEYRLQRQQADGGVAENIKALAWRRLQANKPIIHRWQEVRLVKLVPPAHLPKVPPFQTPSQHCKLPTPPLTTLPSPFHPLIYTGPRSISLVNTRLSPSSLSQRISPHPSANSPSSPTRSSFWPGTPPWTRHGTPDAQPSAPSTPAASSS